MNANLILRRAQPLITFCLFAVVGFFYYADLPGGFLSFEDAEWIRGHRLESPARFTESFLLHTICRRLFEDSLWGFQLPALILHVLNAFLISRIYPLLLPALGAIHDASSTPQAGGTLAGGLFLFCDNIAIREVSALAYPLVTFFALLTLYCWLRHYHSGRLHLLLFALACFFLALLSHSFSFGLIIFLPILDIACRRAAGQRLVWQDLLRKYLALWALFGLFVAIYWEGVMVTGASLLGEHKTPAEAIISFPAHSLYWVLLFFQNLIPGAKPDNPSLHHPQIAESVLLQLALCVALFIVSWFAVRRIWRGNKEAELLSIVFLFFILWKGSSYLPSITAESGFIAHRHFYYKNVGLVVVLAALLDRTALLLHSRAWSIPRYLLMGVISVAALSLYAPQVYRNMPQARVLLSNDHQSLVRFKRPQQHLCQRWEVITQEDFSTRSKTSRSFRCKTLRGLDLSGMDLSRFDFSGSDLSFSNLRQARMEGAVLREVSAIWADFQEASMRGADLTGAYMLGTNFVGVDLSEADLRRAQLGLASIARGLFKNTDLRHTALDHTNGRFARFINADLRGTDLSAVRLDGATFDGIRVK